MKTLLFIGKNGGLGKALVPELSKEYEVIAPPSSQLDLKDPDNVAEFFKSCSPDIVIHSAVKNANNLVHTADNYTAKIQVEINSLGFANLLRNVIPQMREKKFGRIIYFSSVLSKLPIKGTGFYAACKSFNETLVRTCALENASYGITCNTLRLGYMTVGIIKEVPEHILKDVIASIPLKRLGTPEEALNAVKFLINTEYITGASLDLSGGLYGG